MLLAARVLEESRGDRGAYSLVLCPKAIVAQWETKLKSYYSPASNEKTFAGETS